MRRALVGIVAVAAVVGAVAFALPAQAHGHQSLRARDDFLVVRSGRTLTLGDRGILRNDFGDPVTLVAHSQPAHGTLNLDQAGSLRYTPAEGFHGIDSFTYTVSDAVRLFQTHQAPLATIGGVAISAGGYGSGLAPVPGSRDEFYGLTDRGPNVDGPNGTKVEPLPSFDPAIARVRLVGSDAVVEKVIPLRAADGTPYNGRVNTQASTGETITDLNGTVLAADPNGYDSEGLVALRDGTFWVSDEYGPFITHFDAQGRQIERLSPFDGSLPAELAKRVPNKGMEGLTITPDGQTLVGMMQSALQQADFTVKPANVAPVRIVTVDLKTRQTHEYVYLLDNPVTTSSAVSEITALSNTRFVVDERDGNVEPGAYKKLWVADLSGAIDVGPAAAVPGPAYDAAHGGLLVGGKTIEGLVGKQDTATARATLAAAGVTVASKSLDLDLGGLVSGLDPTGGFFGHDKVEGVATTDGGRTLVLSNDSDFGISGLVSTTPPFQLKAKILPDGAQDDGEYLIVDTTRITDATSTATVRILVIA
jgi:hypothetical protein